MKRKWIGGGLLLACVVVGFAFVREYLRNRDYATEVARMEYEIAQLEQGQLATTQLLARLATETKVEGDARTKLNLAKEGESVFVVSDGDEAGLPSATGQSAPRTAIAEDAGLSNPVKWLYYFFAPEKDTAL